MVKEVAASVKGIATVAAINIDDNRPLMPRFEGHVAGIPTLLILTQGRVVESVSGDADRIEKRLLDHLE